MLQLQVWFMSVIFSQTSATNSCWTLTWTEQCVLVGLLSHSSSLNWMKAEVCKGVPYTQKSTQEGEEVERDSDKRKKSSGWKRRQLLRAKREKYTMKQRHIDWEMRCRIFKSYALAQGRNLNKRKSLQSMGYWNENTCLGDTRCHLPYGSSLH